jgi:hypothetical protein
MNDASPDSVAATAAPSDAATTEEQDTTANTALSSNANSVVEFNPSTVASNARVLLDSMTTEPAPEKSESRGRPRKFADADEAKEAKRARDRARYEKKAGKAPDNVSGSDAETAREPKAPASPAPVATMPPQAFEAAASLIVSTMDMVLAAISDGEYRAEDELRSAYTSAWVGYLKSTGKEPPPWVIVSVMSAAYTLPAMNTAPAKSKWEKLTNKIKSLWVGRFGS